MRCVCGSWQAQRPILSTTRILPALGKVATAACLRPSLGALRCPATRRSLRLAVVGGLLSCGVLAPSAALAEEPTGPSTEYRPNEFPPTSARYSALIAGGAVLAGSYGIAFGSSYLWPSSPNSGELRIPVAGPWMALANAGCGTSEQGCETLDVVFRSIFTTLSGLGQAGGVLLLTEALFLPAGPEPKRGVSALLAPGATLQHALLLPPPVDQAQDSSDDLSAPTAKSTSLVVAPLALEASWGVGLSGSF
ncbi:MAG: hypothetical protein RJA70_557 [Pseudomonadota bacterium]